MSITMSIRLTWLRAQVATADSSVDVLPLLTPSLSPLTTVVQKEVTASANDMDPAGFAAYLGVVGLILGALLTSACALYQPQEDEPRTQQSQEEQFRQEQEMLRFAKRI